jgi:hypothetical protein
MVPAPLLRLAGGIACLLSACVPVEATPPAHTTRHEVLALRLGDAGLEVLERSEARGPVPRRKVSAGARVWRVRVEDSAGVSVHEAFVPVPGRIRAELPDATGKLSAVKVEAESQAFTVRVPVDPRARELALFGPASAINGSAKPDAQVELGRVRLKR